MKRIINQNNNKMKIANKTKTKQQQQKTQNKNYWKRNLENKAQQSRYVVADFLMM